MSASTTGLVPELPSSREVGKVYCEYETPGAKFLFEHAKRAGIPLDRAGVMRRLEPSMFR